MKTSHVIGGAFLVGIVGYIWYQNNQKKKAVKTNPQIGEIDAELAALEAEDQSTPPATTNRVKNSRIASMSIRKPKPASASCQYKGKFIYFKGLDPYKKLSPVWYVIPHPEFKGECVKTHYLHRTKDKRFAIANGIALPKEKIYQIESYKDKVGDWM